MKTPKTKISIDTKQGFTMIEVMLFLVISGLLLIGVLGGTYAAIAGQRYHDSVRSFSEFLRQIYGEVISPETLGAGASNNQAIYGKIAVFGLEDSSRNSDLIYTATIVGDVRVPTESGSFIGELSAVNATLFCGNNEQDSTVDTYAPLWGAEIRNSDNRQFTGSVIIARSPTSGTVHTAYTEEQFNLRDYCQPGANSAALSFRNAIQDAARNPESRKFDSSTSLDFCLLSENSVTLRDVRLESDGRNTSAVNILDESDPESKCRR